MKKSQPKINLDIFDCEPVQTAETEWRGMPEFQQSDLAAHRQIIVSFADDQAVKEFFELIGQHYTDKTKSVWFPLRERNKLSELFWIGDDNVGS